MKKRLSILLVTIELFVYIQDGYNTSAASHTGADFLIYPYRIFDSSLPFWHWH